MFVSGRSLCVADWRTKLSVLESFKKAAWQYISLILKCIYLGYMFKRSATFQERKYKLEKTLDPMYNRLDC